MFKAIISSCTRDLGFNVPIRRTYKKELSYDAFGRVSSTTLTTNGEKLTTTNTYDSYSRLSVQTRPQKFKVENVYNQYGYLMAKRAPKAQISDYDWEYLSKLLEQSTANSQKATEQANKLEIKISKYNAYSEYYKKLSTKLIEESNSLNKDAQALRDNANLLDEIINKLEQKSTYFVNLYRNDRAKAYKDLGFNSLIVNKITTLYLDIAYKQYLSRIVCHLLPMGCFLGCLISVFYQDFCMIIIFINYLIGKNRLILLIYIAMIGRKHIKIWVLTPLLSTKLQRFILILHTNNTYRHTIIQELKVKKGKYWPIK
jgi:hypothetical protein